MKNIVLIFASFIALYYQATIASNRESSVKRSRLRDILDEFNDIVSTYETPNMYQMQAPNNVESSYEPSTPSSHSVMQSTAEKVQFVSTPPLKSHHRSWFTIAMLEQHGVSNSMRNTLRNNIESQSRDVDPNSEMFKRKFVWQRKIKRRSAPNSEVVHVPLTPSISEDINAKKVTQSDIPNEIFTTQLPGIAQFKTHESQLKTQILISKPTTSQHATESEAEPLNEQQ